MAPLSGGMEHQTMTTQGFFEKGLTAHELGHQWWGDNVTCDSWADIWVNEGFASYSEQLMLENLYPGQASGNMNDIHNNVKSNPNGSVWVEDSLNEGRIFSGRLTYDKGAAIVHTFRFMMNDDAAFFQALKNIQLAFEHDVANGLDIRDYFEAASGVNFDNAFNEWYYGEGYPTYSARWNVDGSDLILKVTHTTSSSTPTFTNPLELRFTRAGFADTTIRVDIDNNTNYYTIPNMGQVTNLNAIDPNNWVINNVGSIVNDPTMMAGLNDLNTTNSVYLIYPNPSNGNFTIETSELGDNSVTILDTRGRKISDLNFQKVGQLDISNEKSGNYILQITNEKGEKRIQTIVKN
jgi:aminopeptidase N